jgi:hypothetical protein
LAPGKGSNASDFNWRASRLMHFSESPKRCDCIRLLLPYGHGPWWAGRDLNKKLIENEKVDWSEILRKSADFIAQFSGVQDITTAGQWLVDDTGRAVDFRRGMNKKISGDLFIELQPGWVVVHENQTNKTDYTRNNSVLSPLYILGDHIQKESVFRTVKATEIAPTLAFIMRIRPPNASKEAPLQEFIK